MVMALSWWTVKLSCKRSINQHVESAFFALALSMDQAVNSKTAFQNLAGQTRPGRGQQFTNWVHVDDVAGAIKAAMAEKWSGVINVVNDQPIRIAELIDRTLSSEGLEPIRWGDDPKTASSGSSRSKYSSPRPGLRPKASKSDVLKRVYSRSTKCPGLKTTPSSKRVPDASTLLKGHYNNAERSHGGLPQRPPKQ
jgi:hypothetical protein